MSNRKGIDWTIVDWAKKLQQQAKDSKKYRHKLYDKADLKNRKHILDVGCGTCAIACPFGTIYTDLIPYPSSICDVCRNRLAPGEKPLCVNTCRDGSIDYKEVSVEGDMIEVFDDIVVQVSGGSTWEPFLREKAKI